MCVFCAAIPVAAATGAKLNAKQIEARRSAAADGSQPPAERPIARLTLGAVGLLLVGSLVYHTLLAPIWRI